MLLDLTSAAACLKRGVVLTCYVDGRKVFRPCLTEVPAPNPRVGAPERLPRIAASRHR